jgi:hypothetical protein
MDDYMTVTLDNLFPIKVLGYKDSCSYDMERLFRRYKPKDMGWYEVDMTIMSETKVSFDVYDMADLCYGGRGDHQVTFEVTVDPKEVAKWISKKIDQLALERFHYEEELARMKRLKEINQSFRKQLRAQLRRTRKAQKEEAV